MAQLIQAKRLTPEGKIIGLQRKLTVGAADDQYEQEADRVARQVMTTPDAVAANSMQRAMSPEEDKDKMLQTKPLAASITPFVQRQMVNNEEPEDKEKPVQAKFLTETSREPLQRQPETEEEEKEPIQAKSAGSMSDSFEAGGDVETQVSQSKGRGSPLPDPVRAYMEPRFGVDFSDVRVHTGSDALQMNRDVGAQAFTHGSDIYFGEGRSPTNLELTAHELTHVVQQTGGAPLQTKRLDKASSANIDPSIQRTCAACAAGKEEEKGSDPILQRQSVIQREGDDEESESSEGFLTAVSDAASGAWDSASNTASDVVDSASNAASGTWDAASGAASGAWNTASGAASGAGTRHPVQQAGLGTRHPAQQTGLGTRHPVQQAGLGRGIRCSKRGWDAASGAASGAGMQHRVRLAV